MDEEELKSKGVEADAVDDLEGPTEDSENSRIFSEYVLDYDRKFYLLRNASHILQSSVVGISFCN